MAKEERDGSARNEITYKWAILTMLLLSPILLIFRHFGLYREGLGVWACTGVLAYAIRNHWDLSDHQWFWMIVVLAIPLQIPFVLLFPWDKGVGYVAMLPVGALYYALLLAAFKLGETLTDRREDNSST